ncbi:MAG TPA: rubrerythrin family protein [Terracidiphilus sp.]|nr:rubrerythrin family protein [Terracidiphilus sp.]
MFAALDPATETTLRNLLAAYQNELETRDRYLAFADRADDDGHPGIASLFRAAAHAEDIHAKNQARVLHQMGVSVTADCSPCSVKGTLENLKSALTGENHEIASVYPAFIEEAAARINSTAARSFVWALEAEKTHAQLYSEAIRLLESEATDSWIGTARSFYVCPVCACTSHQPAGDNCTICSFPADRAIAVA